MVTLVAELLSVGTELLLGEIVDTNAAFLAQELKARGVNLYWKTVVGDNRGRIVESVRRGLERSDILLVGGGLGPTEDDLTREAIADVLGETPAVDEAYLGRLREFFRARGRTMPEANAKQAWLIPSAESLPNPNGTAPGWFVRAPGGKRIVALPGPPHEMKPMWRDAVLPRLDLPMAGLYTRTLRTVGIGESHLVELLGPDVWRAANPSVATYARRDGVHVRVAASASTPDEAEALAVPLVERIGAAVAGHHYGNDDTTLASALGQLLAARGETVATAESLTGGLVADELSDAPGASAYLLGGVVAYSAGAKTELGVSPATLEAHGAVSRETALELAARVRARLGSTWGVATTGVAGPGPHGGQPAGTVFVAVDGPGGPEVNELKLTGERRRVKEQAAIAALAMLWRRLATAGAS